ncbi:bifunctional heptose 7-phosphate kinase/heptose 1-phosphate adenyltransferase, partial [Chloroflexota bacterium]
MPTGGKKNINESIARSKMKYQIHMDKLKELILKFQKARILVIGDMMLDHYIQGAVSRISPEAPVPIINVSSEVFKLGGAANAINNITALGGKAVAIGYTGADLNGRKLRSLLKKMGVDTKWVVTVQDRPTTTKTRITAGQQIARFDKEVTNDIDPKYTKQFLDFIGKNIDDVDAILISDYDKGVVTGRLLKDVIPLARRHGKPIVIDPKYRHFSDYEGVTVVLPNISEASTATGVDPAEEDAIRKMGQSILRKLQCDAVLITRGKDGISLFEGKGK